ncbi:MAG TPA: molybdopterin cofactor-binding domain-containing protein [Anaerolineae bacterium]|nr:molybdopterin cofactor-binding domain-containing protein [Anaerolineae bacterium]
MSDMQAYTLQVNGQRREVTAAPNTLLMDVLRDQLRLTGVKDGCATGHCGSCMIIKDGEAVRSCLVPMKRADNAHITTIEGLAAPDGSVHPVQHAYIDQGATQCGFCTPGFIMSTVALLSKNPSPTLEEIYKAHQWNICRCTGHNAIIRAIQQAAGQAVPPLPSVKNPLKAVGRPLPRPDAIDKVTGKGIYADDLYVEGMLHARALRSRYPHALLKNVDVSKAKAMPGVIAVLTADDIPGRKDCGVHEIDWPVLCRAADKVRYVGDAIALVVAETEEIAADALRLIEVEYEPLPVVAGPREAAQSNAPLVHDATRVERLGHGAHGNFLAHFHLASGDVAKGFAEADVVVEREYRTQTVEHAFIEPEAALAVPEANGRVTVYCGGQIPFGDRAQIAATLDVPEDRIRVINCLIGGGFGGKEDVSVQIHVALAAWITRRPVKMVLSRKESLLVHPKRHATIIKMKTGAKKDGALVAHEVEIYGDGGAYASLSNHVMLRATTHAAGPYEVPNATVNTYAMYTNNVPSGAFRGFGVTQSAFAMESQMDVLAEALGLSPLEIRRKNILAVGKKTLAGHTLTESCGLRQALEAVTAEMEKHPLDFTPHPTTRPPDHPTTRPLAAVEGDKRRAWGVACAYKNTGFGSGAYDAAGAEVEVFADGRAAVRAGAAEIGQGLVGVLAQIVSEELGVPYPQVDVLVSDTDLTPDGQATTASRQTYVSGNAARHASREVRALLSQTAAEMLDAPPESLTFADGYVIHDSRRVALSDVVKAARREGRMPKVSYQYVAPMAPQYHHFAFGFGAQAALVEVDVKTGETRVLKVIAANDVGRVINPLALQGQVEGSISMGLGMALQENFVMEDGAVKTDSLYKCHLPTIDQTPEVISFFVEEETQDGPYGAKGVGELASIPTTPAIVNAIYHATGIRCYSLPADKKWLKQALSERM